MPSASVVGPFMIDVIFKGIALGALQLTLNLAAFPPTSNNNRVIWSRKQEPRIIPRARVEHLRRPTTCNTLAN